jgi:hypothetical protein
MRTIASLLVASLGAAVLGVGYVYISVYRALGPAEAGFYECVQLWGRVSLCTGIVLASVCLAVGRRRARPFRLVLALGYSVLVFLQLPAIYGWFAGHGYGISDHPGSFVIHWRYGIPHVMLLAIGAFVLYSIVHDVLPGSQSRK